MENAPGFRHELKFCIGYADYLILRSRLKPVMASDTNVNANGNYTIRSIYFDNYRDKAFLEKLNGISRREKFRIRYYNDDLTYITLEKKMKIDDLCMKLSTPLTEVQCRKLLAGENPLLPCRGDSPESESVQKNGVHTPPFQEISEVTADDTEPESTNLIQELCFKMKSQLLRPRVLVSYTREPYLYPAGNVRITFDFNIRSTLYQQDFLQKQPVDIDTSDIPGQVIMEIKYDNFLPDFISALIRNIDFRQESFSKYGACRKFG